jgi:putative tryptophan/tyrosine transport system substrate-binding protein
MQRREFVGLVAGAAAWPLLTARAQRPVLPVVGYIHPGKADDQARNTEAFRKGLGEIGYIDGQNFRLEYHWLEGQYERAPPLLADLVRRRVAVIAVTSAVLALAAKAATTTTPIVFGVGDDPVKLGLVPSLARPGGNTTGINFFYAEVVAKRLGLLHELVPKAVRMAVLVNPASAPMTEPTLLDVREAARVLGLQVQVLNGLSSSSINRPHVRSASRCRRRCSPSPTR